MALEAADPTEAQIDRANDFCHAFFRFIISEGVQPSDALVYVAAAAAQTVCNVAICAEVEKTAAFNAFAANTVYFMNLMSEDRKTAYPVPRIN